MVERAELEREVETLISYADGVPRDDDVLFDRTDALVRLNPGMALEIGQALLYSANPDRRETGVKLIGVAAAIDSTLRDVALPSLRPILRDARVGPLSAAIVQLGHLDDTGSRDLILAQAGHADSAVRYAVAFALPAIGLDDVALATLRELMLDDDDDVRDWAIFGLAAQSSAEDQVTRDALLEAVEDDVYEIRVEAIVGLARRQDERVRSYLMQELADPHHADLLDDAVDFLDHGTGRDWLSDSSAEAI